MEENLRRKYASVRTRRLTQTSLSFERRIYVISSRHFCLSAYQQFQMAIHMGTHNDGDGMVVLVFPHPVKKSNLYDNYAAKVFVL